MQGRREWVESLRYFPAAGSYVLTTKHDDYISTQELLRSTSPQPSKQIQNFWDDGFEVSHLLWLDERWYVIAHRPKPGQHKKIQKTLFQTQFPQSDVNDYIANGNEILWMDYGNKQWCFIVDSAARGPTYFQQCFTFESFPASFLQDRVWPVGKVVKHLVFSGTHWVAIIGEGEGTFHTQDLLSYSSWPGDAMMTLVENGSASLHSLHYDTTDEMWYIIIEKKAQHLKGGSRELINTISVKFTHQPPTARLTELGLTQ